MRLTILSCMVLLCQAPVLHAQPAPATTNGTVQQLSLHDCIRMAVERNLTILIGDNISLGDTADLDERTAGKLGLEERRLELEGSYGYYDPVLSLTGGGLYEAQGQYGNGIGGGGNIASKTVASKEWNATYGLELDGILPTGTRYEFTAGMNRIWDPEENDLFRPSFQYRYDS